MLHISWCFAAHIRAVFSCDGAKDAIQCGSLQSRADVLLQEAIDAFGQVVLVLSDNVEIICEYLGVAGEEGFEAGSKIRARVVLGFQWRCSDGAVEVFYRVNTLRVFYGARHSIP